MDVNPGHTRRGTPYKPPVDPALGMPLSMVDASPGLLDMQSTADSRRPSQDRFADLPYATNATADATNHAIEDADADAASLQDYLNTDIPDASNESLEDYASEAARIQDDTDDNINLEEYVQSSIAESREDLRNYIDAATQKSAIAAHRAKAEIDATLQDLRDEMEGIKDDVATGHTKFGEGMAFDAHKIKELQTKTDDISRVQRTHGTEQATHKNALLKLIEANKQRIPTTTGATLASMERLLAPLLERMNALEQHNILLTNELHNLQDKLRLNAARSDSTPARVAAVSFGAQQSSRTATQPSQTPGQGGPTHSSSTPSNSDQQTTSETTIGSLTVANMETAPTATMAAFGGSQQKIDRQLVLPKLPEKERTLSSDNDLQDALAYNRWFQESTLALITGGLQVAVTHKAPRLMDVAYAEYISRNAHAYKAIKTAAPKTLQRQLQNLQSDPNSALKAWGLIKDFYVRKGNSYNVALNNCLRNMCPDATDDMASYQAMAEDIQGHFMLMSVPLEEQQLVRSFYDGLVVHDPTWQTMYKDMIATLGPERAWTWPSAKVFFQEQDDLRKLSAGPGSCVLPLGYTSTPNLPKAAMNRMGPNGPSQNFENDPSGGHERHPQSGNSQFAREDEDANIVCSACGLMGHRDALCPTITKAWGRVNGGGRGRGKPRSSWSPNRGRGRGSYAENWRAPPYNQGGYPGQPMQNQGYNDHPILNNPGHPGANANPRPGAPAAPAAPVGPAPQAASHAPAGPATTGDAQGIPPASANAAAPLA